MSPRPTVVADSRFEQDCFEYHRSEHDALEMVVNVLIYLVPMALLLGLIGLFGFMWTLRSGQYDDLDGAAVRILPDDDIEE